jgi:hypothetical protein
MRCMRSLTSVGGTGVCVRPLLLQVLFWVRSERQLAGQIHYNLLVSDGLSSSAWTMRCGTTRCSPRTAIVC